MARTSPPPRPLQPGRVTTLMDNHGFLLMQGGEEALFHRRGVAEPWGFEDFKVGDQVVCTIVNVRVKGELKVRAYDVRMMDPSRKPGR